MEEKEGTYPAFVGGIDVKNGEVDELEDKSNTVNGDHKNAVWMHKRQPIEHPKRTV